MIGRFIRFVAVTFVGIAVVAVAATAVMTIWSRGHEGNLIRSNAGRFTAETNVHNELLQRNLTLVGFHKCDYFTGLSVFTTLAGSSCPWYMSDESAVSNVQERID